MSGLELLHYRTPFVLFCLAAYCHCIDTILPVTVGYMSGVPDINCIYYAFLTSGISQHSIAESFNTGSDIEFLTHLPNGIVTVSTPLFQTANHPDIFTVGLYRHIIVKRQMALSNESVHGPRLQQNIKQVCKSFTVQPAWSCSQSQFLRLRMGNNQLFVGISQSMMGFVYHYQNRFVIQIPIMS